MHFSYVGIRRGAHRSLRAVNIWAGLPGSDSLCPESRQHPGRAHGHRTLGRYSHLREEFPGSGGEQNACARKGGLSVLTPKSDLNMYFIIKST